MAEETNTLQIAGQEVECILKKKLSTRRLTLRLDFSKRLYISAPRFMSTHRIMEFLEEKENWLKKNLEKIDEKNQEKAEHKKEFKNGESFALLGQKYSLDLRFMTKKRPKAYFECLEDGRNVLALEINEDTPFRDISVVAKGVIEKLYKKSAKDHFEKRLEEINKAHYKFRYNKVRVKNQTTRYGSCSSKGNLNFNWKVIMARPEVIDYLLAHELSHLKEMNHSAKFWSLVERACPDYKKHRKWLKTKGHTLMI